MSAYFTNIVNTYKNGFKLKTDMPLLGVKGIELDILSVRMDDDDMYAEPHTETLANKRPLKTLKRFEEIICEY